VMLLVHFANHVRIGELIVGIHNDCRYRATGSLEDVDQCRPHVLMRGIGNNGAVKHIAHFVEYRKHLGFQWDLEQQQQQQQQQDSGKGSGERCKNTSKVVERRETTERRETKGGQARAVSV
jgi:hypothetical protein